MIRISQLHLSIDHSAADLKAAILKKLRISDTRLLAFMIAKKSLDARDRSNIRYSYTIDCSISRENEYLKHCRNEKITPAPDRSYHFPEYGTAVMKERPVVIGSGPAGLFCAYFLAEKGFRPIVIERGDPVEKRFLTVQDFWKTNVLDPESNVQFGEGGAGTFSDGKLNTGINDTSGRIGLVLRTFVKHGAPEEITYINKPHLGTDVLMRIVSGMRERILSQGGEFRYRTVFREFCTEKGVLKGILVNDGDFLPAQTVVLAIGHSARDTFEYLIDRSPLTITAKPFAVGVRAEHLQAEIDQARYGQDPNLQLPPADYKLTYHSSRGNSVYSFCMCPGGYVVNSSSENGMLCINGMSYSGRDSANANSAIVVAVNPSDSPKQNIEFQRMLEQKAFQAGNGKIISQRLEDFEQGRVSEAFGKIKPVHKGETVMADIRHVLPEEICLDISEAIHYFAGQIEGFDDPDVLLSAVESRTSSPVRILRDDQFQSCIKGVYPAGEGAGYAGGITSAAVDGIKVFEAVCSRFYPG